MKPGPGNRREDAGPARSAGVPVGHERRSELVHGDDRPEPRRAQRLEEGDVLRPGQAEDGVRAERLEGLADELRARHRCPRLTLESRRAGAARPSEPSCGSRLTSSRYRRSRAEGAGLRGLEQQAHLEIASELGLEVGHWVQGRVGEIVRGDALLGKPPEDVPSEEGRGAELQVLRVGGRADRVRDGMGTEKDELGRDGLPVGQPRVVEPGEPARVQSFEVALEGGARQVEPGALALVDLGVEAKEALEIVVLRHGETLRGASVDEPPQVLLHPRPESVHVRQRHDVGVVRARAPAFGQQRADVGQGTPATQADPAVVQAPRGRRAGIRGSRCAATCAATGIASRRAAGRFRCSRAGAAARRRCPHGSAARRARCPRASRHPCARRGCESSRRRLAQSASRYSGVL